jgi:hypothetical protein
LYPRDRRLQRCRFGVEQRENTDVAQFELPLRDAQ